MELVVTLDPKSTTATFQSASGFVYTFQPDTPTFMTLHHLGSSSRLPTGKNTAMSPEEMTSVNTGNPLLDSSCQVVSRLYEATHSALTGEPTSDPSRQSFDVKDVMSDTVFDAVFPRDQDKSVVVDNSGLARGLESHTRLLDDTGNSKLSSSNSSGSFVLNTEAVARTDNNNPGGNPLDKLDGTPEEKARRAVEGVLESDLIANANEKARNFFRLQQRLSKHQAELDDHPVTRPPMIYSSMALDSDEVFVGAVGVVVGSQRLDFTLFLEDVNELRWRERKRSSVDVNKRRGIKKGTGRPFRIVFPSDSTLYKKRLKYEPGEPPVYVKVGAEAIEALQARRDLLIWSFALASTRTVATHVLMQVMFTKLRNIIPFLGLGDVEVGSALGAFSKFGALAYHLGLSSRFDKVQKAGDVVVLTGSKARTALSLLLATMPDADEARGVIAEFVFHRASNSLTRVANLVALASTDNNEEEDDEDEVDSDEVFAARVNGRKAQEAALLNQEFLAAGEALLREQLETVKGDDVIVAVDCAPEQQAALSRAGAAVVSVDSAGLDLDLKPHLKRKLLVAAAVSTLSASGGVIVATGNALKAVHELSWKPKPNEFKSMTPSRFVRAFYIFNSRDNDAKNSVVGLNVTSFHVDRISAKRDGVALTLATLRAIILTKIPLSDEKPFVTKALWKTLLPKAEDLNPPNMRQDQSAVVGDIAAQRPKDVVKGILSDSLSVALPRMDLPSVMAQLEAVAKAARSGIAALDGIGSSDGKKYLHGLPTRIPPSLSSHLASLDREKWSMSDLKFTLETWLASNLKLFPNLVLSNVRSKLKLTGTAAQVLANLAREPVMDLEKVATVVLKSMRTALRGWLGDLVGSALVKVQAQATALLVQLASHRVSDSNAWNLVDGAEVRVAAVKETLQKQTSNLARQLAKARHWSIDHARANAVASATLELVFAVAPILSLMPDNVKNALEFFKCSKNERKSVARTARVIMQLTTSHLKSNPETVKMAWPELVSAVEIVVAVANATDKELQEVDLSGATMSAPLQIAAGLWAKEDGRLVRPHLSSSTRRSTGAYSAPNTGSVKSRKTDYGLLQLALAIAADAFASVDPNQASVEMSKLHLSQMLSRSLGLPEQWSTLCGDCSLVLLDHGDPIRETESRVPCSRCLAPIGPQADMRWWEDAVSGLDVKVDSRRRKWASSITWRVSTDRGASVAMRLGATKASTAVMSQLEKDGLSATLAGVKAVAAAEPGLGTTWGEKVEPIVKALADGKGVSEKKMGTVESLHGALQTLVDAGQDKFTETMQLAATATASKSKSLVVKSATTRRRQGLRQRWRDLVPLEVPVVWGDGHAKRGSAGRGLTYANIGALEAIADLTRVLVVGEGGSSACCSKCFTRLGPGGALLGTSGRQWRAGEENLQDRQGYKLRHCPNCGLLAARDHGSTLSIGLISLVLLVHGRKLFGSNKATEKLREDDWGQEEVLWTMQDNKVYSRWIAASMKGNSEGSPASLVEAVDAGAGTEAGDDLETHVAADDGAGVGWDLDDDDDHDARASDFGADDGAGADASWDPGGDPTWTDDGLGGDAVEGMDWMPTQEPSAEIGLGSKRPLDGARDADSHQRDGVKRQRRRSPRPGRTGEEEEEEAGFIYATARMLFNIAHSKMSALMSWFWSSWPVESYSK